MTSAGSPRTFCSANATGAGPVTSRYRPQSNTTSRPCPTSSAPSDATITCSAYTAAAFESPSRTPNTSITGGPNVATGPAPARAGSAPTSTYSSGESPTSPDHGHGQLPGDGRTRRTPRQRSLVCPRRLLGPTGRQAFRTRRGHLAPPHSLRVVHRPRSPRQVAASRSLAAPLHEIAQLQRAIRSGGVPSKVSNAQVSRTPAAQLERERTPGRGGVDQYRLPRSSPW